MALRMLEITALVMGAIVGLAVSGLVVSVPLDLGAQYIFAAITISLLLIASNLPGRQITIFLATLSIIVSSRYLYWRTTQTLHFDTVAGAIFGFGLYLAEAYAWLVLFFGYLQTIWPLDRPVRTLHEDPALWPTVDIFIPTYNESLSIVGDTVLAAMNIDYPRDKVKIYLLDDGRREDFKRFAAESGVEYMTRNNNAHAKAGNLNHALQHSKSELICIFDCDHVATRAFLQFTVGWFLDDPNLALIQTPHHFYSPDPFERNLETGSRIPNEGELFYGPVQKGNDFWNAAFFCGSCAVIRRSALEEIGGFAVETVTEDAHTALKLQKRGWNSAYLHVKLAAGLATERLAIHIGQRMRWARGMTQILRNDNPLIGGKLSLFQRLCYLNAMLHFQFSLPRIVFLTSPLVYLLLGENLIAASAWSIIAYAGPHLVHAIVTNKRLQGHERGAFWGEIYETVLSFHLVRVTLGTFLNPKAGTFNVTEKGGMLPKDYLDIKIVRPHVITAIILSLGCIAGCAKLFFPGRFIGDPPVLALNVSWALFNLMMLLCAIAVGREVRQVRTSVRVDCELPVVLILADGHTVQAQTENLSMGGLAVIFPLEAGLDMSRVTDVELPCGTGTMVAPVTVVRITGHKINLRFGDMPLPLRRDLVKSILGRADSWTPEHQPKALSFTQSVTAIAWAIFGLFRWSRATVKARRAAALVAQSAPPPPPPPPPPATERQEGASVTAIAACLVLGLALMPWRPALAQAAPPPPPPAPAAEMPAAAPEPAAVPPAAAVPAPVAPSLPDADPEVQRKLVLTFRDMGASNPIRLISSHGEASLPVNLRSDEVVTAAKLTLTFGYSPSLIPELSHLAAFMNGELIGSVQLVRERSGGVTVELPINPALFTTRNQINLQFIAHYTRDCEDPLQSTLWSVISNKNSMLELTVQRLPQQDDLRHLPAPFFDSGDMRALNLPFVLAPQPEDDVLKAAGVVAGYFGMAASYRGFSFPVHSEGLPHDHAVVIATTDQTIPGLTLPAISGPTVAVIANPVSPSRKLLLILGRTGEEVRAAAFTLGVGGRALSGASAVVSMPQLQPHQPYDAKRWIATDRPVRLGELVDPQTLQGSGLLTGTLTASFNSAPDLFAWGDDGIALDIRYRYPNAPWLDKDLSRLDVGLNDKFLRALPTMGATPADQLRGLVTSDNFVMNEGRVSAPPYLIFGRNQLQFLFDLKSNKKGGCQGYLPEGVHSAIDPDSTIDLTNLHHFAKLPNLGYFGGAGFPFTRMADLSATVAVFSDQPSDAEVEAFLVLMGRFADSTGVAATGLTISRNGAGGGFVDKDLLVIGTMDLAAKLNSVLATSPFQVQGDKLKVDMSPSIDHFFSFMGKDPIGAQRNDADKVLVGSPDFAGILSYRSPFTADRVIVALLAVKPERLREMVYDLADPVENVKVGGDLAIASGDGFTSFAVTEPFWAGQLPLQVTARWYLSNHPVLMILVLLAGAFLLTLPVYFALRAIARWRLRRRTE